MKDPVLALLSKISNDNIPAVRQQLADLCSSVIRSRLALWAPDVTGKYRLDLDPPDLELTRHLLQLSSDPASEVSNHSIQASYYYLDT